MPDAPRPPIDRTTVIVTLCCVAIGLLLCAVALRWGASSLRLVNEGATVRGVVAGSACQRSGSRHCVLAVHHTDRQGAVRVVSVPGESVSFTLAQGDVVDVVSLPRAGLPDDVRLKRFSSLWLGPLATLLVALPFLAVGGVFVYVTWLQRPARPPA